jgi:hypothetical protein|tara:strand:- start:169 stop:411 length:243 start_codon:yes stop_codon:yes gene_type:complete
MKYYIMMPGDTNESTIFESNLLGEVSFKVFWAAQGLNALMKMVDRQPEMLEVVTIKTERGESISVEQFLERIQNLQVRSN